MQALDSLGDVMQAQLQLHQACWVTEHAGMKDAKCKQKCVDDEESPSQKAESRFEGLVKLCAWIWQLVSPSTSLPTCCS